MSSPQKIAVIGLGYVGLPLAVALARHWPVLGFDVDTSRVVELQAGHDRTGEVEDGDIGSGALSLSSDPAAMAGCDLFIVTVPTPVTANNEPDLSAVEAACATVGPYLTTGATFVLESTVYPGVTEEICGPALSAASGLAPGKEFRLGYSPERMNPGDKAHGLAQLTKVVAGQDADTTAFLAAVYGKVTNGNVFEARDIRTAEAAKVIENAQRDINIAFTNEVAIIFNKLGLSMHDVLAAARTKWNFLPFEPGLVGGHCIGVDPYYLAYKAEQIGHQAEVILAGRRINDGMGTYVADSVHREMAAGGHILLMGLTFKENVPDLRNSLVIEIYRRLIELGHSVSAHDPMADPVAAKAIYGVELLAELSADAPYDAVIGAVPHAAYRALNAATLGTLLKPAGLVADVKGIWRDIEFPSGIRRWQL
jgi:UDP-N-acetyl-D-galactosamine dehydrogenase